MSLKKVYSWKKKDVKCYDNRLFLLEGILNILVILGLINDNNQIRSFYLLILWNYKDFFGNYLKFWEEEENFDLIEFILII